MIAPRHSRLSDATFAPNYEVRSTGPISVRQGRIPASRSTDGVSSLRIGLLRTLFALDIVGAGGPGVVLLIAPHLASEWLFASQLTPDAGTLVLGCIWLAMGLLAIAGLFRPVAFCSLLILQMAYKALWLAAVGVPSLLAGDDVPGLLTVIFALWTAAVAAVVPWRVFGRGWTCTSDEHTC